MSPFQRFFPLYLCCISTFLPDPLVVSAYSPISYSQSKSAYPQIITSFGKHRYFSEITQAFSQSPTKLHSTLQQEEDQGETLSPSQTLPTKTDDDWEYEEYEVLQESDFYNSEWKVGTLWDSKMDNIQTTWCRLVVKDDQNVAIWGDGAVGKWNFDVPSQFIGISKESFGGWLGKQIWAGVVDDFYYMQGTVRGWSPISPASVMAQWQAKRLGFSEEETGIAPWFQQEESDIDSNSMEESR
jgi:hypothetical protein